MLTNSAKYILNINILFIFIAITPFTNGTIGMIIVPVSLFIIFLQLFQIENLKFTTPILVLMLTTIITELFSIYIIGFGYSLGYFSRYILYIAFIYLVVNSPPISKNNFNNLITYFSILVMLSASAGIIMDRYIFLNGYDRLLGLANSPVALSLASIIPIIIYLYAFYFYDLILTNLNKALIIISIIILIMSGSRQPLIGLVFIGFATYIYKSSFRSKLAIGFTLIPALAILFSVYYEQITSISRGIYQITVLLTEPSQAILDPSSQSRVRYLQSVFEHWDNYSIYLPSGFNSFSVLYAQQGFRPNTAFHNDLVLPLLEYGIIFAILNFVMLLILVRNNIRRAIFVFLMFVLCSSLNNTFYYTYITLIFIFLGFQRVKNEVL